MLIPGLGPFIAAGPIWAALSGAATGGATGGVSSALIGSGFAEYEARQQETRLDDGNALISVRVADSIEEEQVF